MAVTHTRFSESTWFTGVAVAISVKVRARTAENCILLFIGDRNDTVRVWVTDEADLSCCWKRD